MTTMRITALATCVTVAGPLNAAAAAAQQTSACRGADSTGAQLIYDLSMYTTATESTFVAARDSLRLPSVPASQIALVTTSSICSKVASAYGANVSGPASRLSGRVYVVQVGTTRYVALDPTYYYNAARPTDGTRMVLANTYKVLVKF